MSHMSHIVTVTKSCDKEKDIEGSRTDNIIQYNNNMFVTTLS